MNLLKILLVVCLSIAAIAVSYYAPGYVWIDFYQSVDCHGELIGQEGYPTGVCLLIYNASTGIAMSSKIYSCDADTEFYQEYSDLSCTTPAFNWTKALACTNSSTADRFNSGQGYCNSDQTKLPLPSGPMVVETLYNTAESCDTVSEFNVFANGVCFKDGIRSVAFQWPNVTSYVDKGCNIFLGENTLPQMCTLVSQHPAQFGPNNVVARQWNYSDLPEAQTPTFPPSSNPTAVPTVATSALPTEEPSALPSAAPSADPTPAPSSATSAIPTEPPSLPPTSPPTQPPFESPTLPPSVAPTPASSPADAPTPAPTISPSASPSALPTPVFTPAPTPVVTLAPTLNSSSNEQLSFLSSITLSGLTASDLDAPSQVTVVTTSAVMMNIPISCVAFVSSVQSNGAWLRAPKLLRRASAEVPLDGTVTAAVTISTNVPLAGSPYPSADALYAALTQALNTSVADGEYTSNLQSYAKSCDAQVLYNAQAVAVSSAAPVVSVITSKPTSSPTSAPAAVTDHVALTVGSVIPGLFIIAVGVCVLRLRRARSASLNELSSETGEMMDFVMKGVTVALAVNLLLTSSYSTEQTPFQLLLASRLLIFSACVLFIAMFVVPAKLAVNKRTGISLLLFHDALQDSGAISLYSVLIIAAFFDVSMLRYLPWRRSAFTAAMHGYPNLMLIRCSLYGMFLSSLIQAAATLPSLARTSDASATTRAKDGALLVFSLFNAVRAFIAIVLQMKKLNSVEFKMAIVSERDVVALANFVHSTDSSNSPTAEMNDLKKEIAVSGASSDGAYTPNQISDMLAVAQSRKESSHSPTEESNPMHQDDPFSSSAATNEAVDERGILFASKINYADETVSILKEQVRTAGLTPLEFIPLPALKAELASLFECANNGTPYDTARLDYLLLCLDHNPEYKEEQELAKAQWRAEMAPFLLASLQEMRSFIPPHIFKCSEGDLINTDGYSKALAKRILTKKCLWLVRVSTSDIERMHIAELRGRFNPEAQGLDVVETAAIYSVLPQHFANDPDRQKARWLASVEQNCKSMHAQLQRGLSGPKRRNPVYKNQEPAYTNRDSLHEMSGVVATDVFAPRTSFRELEKRSNGATQDAAPANDLPAPAAVAEVSPSPVSRTLVQLLGAALSSSGIFLSRATKVPHPAAAAVVEESAPPSEATTSPVRTTTGFGTDLSRALAARKVPLAKSSVVHDEGGF